MLCGDGRVLGTQWLGVPGAEAKRSLFERDVDVGSLESVSHFGLHHFCSGETMG